MSLSARKALGRAETAQVSDTDSIKRDGSAFEGYGNDRTGGKSCTCFLLNSVHVPQ